MGLLEQTMPGAKVGDCDIKLHLFRLILQPPALWSPRSMITLYPHPQVVQQVGECNVSLALGAPLGPEKAEPTPHPY